MSAQFSAHESDDWPFYTQVKLAASRHNTLVRYYQQQGQLNLLSDTKDAPELGYATQELAEFRFRLADDIEASATRLRDYTLGTTDTMLHAKPLCELDSSDFSSDDLEEDATWYAQLCLPGMPSPFYSWGVPTAPMRFHRGTFHRRLTMQTAIKRNLQYHEPELCILPEDIRYRVCDATDTAETIAFAVLDTSGSMAAPAKVLGRKFFTHLSRFLHQRYPYIPVVYIVHDLQARTVEANEFICCHEAGGTLCSSAFAKLLEILNDGYYQSVHSCYIFYVSDGHNLPSDNPRTLQLMTQLAERAQLLTYVETWHAQLSTLSPLFQGLQHINLPTCKCLRLSEQESIRRLFFTMLDNTQHAW